MFALDLAAGVTGRLLGATTAAIHTVRGPRPIHTTGLLLAGTMRWRPASTARSGIAWIDERRPGELPVVARFSRGAALPAPLPDVIGLALRPGEGRGEADLLLAATGIGVPGRFLIRPRRSPGGALLSTFMPYRGTLGPVLIAARSVAPAAIPARMEDLRGTLGATVWRLELLFAAPLGRWHRFADLELRSAPGPIDAAAPRFDPVLGAPRGAGTYGWARALREPAYATARRPR